MVVKFCSPNYDGCEFYIDRASMELLILNYLSTLKNDPDI